MNKSSLINRIRIRSTYNKELANHIFDFTIEEIKKAILSRKAFLIDEFGIFEVEHREMKTVNDFKKRAEILLPPKDKLVFKPSNEMTKLLKD